MSIPATPAPVPAVRVSTLADRLLGRRSLVTDALLILAGTALVAVLAQVTVPFYPVPVTGQTLGVLLVGASLGAWRGATSLGLYLVAGVAGAPIFAGFTGGPAMVLKPSFGFIIGFVAAAAVIGWAAEHGWDRSFWKSLTAAAAGSVIPFLVGVPYMAMILPSVGLPNDFVSLMELGVLPFIIGGVIKWAIAAAVLPVAWRLLRGRDESPELSGSRPGRDA